MKQGEKMILCYKFDCDYAEPFGICEAKKCTKQNITINKDKVCIDYTAKTKQTKED